MQKIDKILQQSMNKRGIGKEALSAQICYYADELSENLYKTISYQNGVLKVSVLSSSQAADFDIRREEFIDKINQKIGKNMIRSIRILNCN